LPQKGNTTAAAQTASWESSKRGQYSQQRQQDNNVQGTEPLVPPASKQDSLAEDARRPARRRAQQKSCAATTRQTRCGIFLRPYIFHMPFCMECTAFNILLPVSARKFAANIRNWAYLQSEIFAL